MPDPVDPTAAPPGPGRIPSGGPVPAPADSRPARRDEMTRRAVAAAVAVARDHGLRVDEPVVLNDRFSVQVYLAPAPVVAGVSTWTAAIRPGNAAGMARRVAVTEHLEPVGAPVVGNARSCHPACTSTTACS